MQNRKTMCFPFKIVSTFALIFGLAACSSTIRINSENQNSRVSILVIHYTTGDFADSLGALTIASNRPVSSHYLIPEVQDATYGKGQLKVHQLVEETGRAWHAGRSQWGNKTNLNDQSIGIELVNRAACLKAFEEREDHDNHSVNQKNGDEPPSEFCFYPDYSEEQIALLIELSQGILERHPDIRPTSVIGHSDIAPPRKTDPGPRFPWQRLYKAGIGAWYDNETVIKYWRKFLSLPPSVLSVQLALQTYGYKIELSGEYDKQSQSVIRAFQMHFNPSMVTQELDVKTAAILFALVEKYYPNTIETLNSLHQGINLDSGSRTIIGKKIWQNEAGGTIEGLTHWNQSEGFASLGIGHFIWYPENKQFIFKESFPDLINFMIAKGVVVPEWMVNSACPWANLESFNTDVNSIKMNDLRQFLSRTMEYQLDFIVQRSQASLEKMLLDTNRKHWRKLIDNYHSLAQSPEGMYALIDYVNFKGEGIKDSERYQGKGWGLKDVLLHMPGKTNNALQEFSASAKEILKRRVKYGPEGESAWLNNWLRRVDGYRSTLN